MKSANILFWTAAVCALMISPAGLAQNTGNEVTAPGCENLENCDPKAANQKLHGKSVLTNLADDGKALRTVMYAHHQDVLQRAPLNTQPPDPDEEPDVNGGFLMPTFYVEDVGGERPPCCAFANNEFLWQSSPGLVEILGPGNWRVHQEPGLAERLEIAPDQGKFIYGYIYLSAHAAPNSAPNSGISPSVMPAVGVYMQLTQGRFPGSGTVIATGDTGVGKGAAASSWDTDASQATLIQAPGGDSVWEFKVAMEVSKSHPYIESVWEADPKERGYVVEIIPYQIESPQVRVTQADWRFRTGWDYPPRLVIDVQNPLVTKHTLVHTFDDFLFFRWSFISPWGSYDLDANSLSLRVEGPGGVLGPGDIEFVKLKHSVDHDGHFKPLNATWRYDYVNKPLAPGMYKVNAMVHNLQGTYMLQWQEDFTVDAAGIPQVHSLGGGSSSAGTLKSVEGGDSPGLGAAGLLAAAAAAIVMVRRRKQ